MIMVIVWDESCHQQYDHFNPKSTGGGGIFTCLATFFVLVITEVVLGVYEPIVN